jgi:hypothetical protein
MADHTVFRRLVGRREGSTRSGSGNPNLGITAYCSVGVIQENVVFVDGLLDIGGPWADFAEAQHTVGRPHGGNKWLGCASVKSPDGGFVMVPDEYDTSPDRTIRNCVVWDAHDEGMNFDRAGDLDLDGVTIYKSTSNNYDGFRTVSPVSGTVRDVIVCGAARYALSSVITPDYIDANGTWGLAAYNQTTPTHAVTTNPFADGPPHSLTYPFRIEAESALKGSGYGGADKGANITNLIGVDGAFADDAGVETAGGALWPWPNEAAIRTAMRGDSARGFCADGETLTHYLWNLLGNGSPY